MKLITIPIYLILNKICGNLKFLKIIKYVFGMPCLCPNHTHTPSMI